MVRSSETVLPSASAQTPTHNINVLSTNPLISPRQLKAELVAEPAHLQAVLEARQTMQAILRGEDHRLLAMVGPCSIHDVEAALDYARRLNAVRQQVQDRLFIVMRVYFEKPRTTIGWKGLINDPHLDGSFDMDTGVHLARKLLLDITELGLPAGTELLDPISPQYLDDLLSWASIGARTTESQTHRQMASGLSMPVGFKNSTDGNTQVAVDAMKSARSSHHFLGIDDEGYTCVVTTRGNPYGHLVLRGGAGRPNYDPGNVREAVALLEKAGLPGAVLIDCSHANSGKKHEQQEKVWRSVIEQRASGNAAILGAMLESNLEPGNQPIPADRSQLRYGVSITDACLGWPRTAELLQWAYDRLA